MRPRKIIFECHVGSKLYGTNRPDSDDDFMGVFLPSTEDMFSLQNCPSEWSLNEKVSAGARNSVGDVDRKYYSLQKFLNLATQGQPKQLEMLFAPGDKILITSPEWEKIVNNRDMFLSKNSVLPFIGFAKAQAYKATLKGDNLNNIRAIISYLDGINLNGLTVEHFVSRHKSGIPCLNNIVEVEYRPGVKVQCVEIAGRKFEFTQPLKGMINKLKELESKYGTRSEAAAEAGYDYKSLSHAYRLLYEAQEILTTGKLQFPLQTDVSASLRSIRSGTYRADYFQEIEDKLTELKNIKSSLPDDVNWKKVNALCTEMLMEYHGET